MEAVRKSQVTIQSLLEFFGDYSVRGWNISLSSFHLVGIAEATYLIFQSSNHKATYLIFLVQIAKVEDGQTEEDGEIEEEAIPGGGCRR